jgi:hypothetical protein
MTPPDSWRDRALCAASPIPHRLWVNPSKANALQVAAMADCCTACPVKAECAADMEARNDYVGYRAGTLWSSHSFGDHRPAAPASRTFTCVWCGTLFQASGRANPAKWCSQRCSNQAKWAAKRKAQAVINAQTPASVRNAARDARRAARRTPEDITHDLREWANPIGNPPPLRAVVATETHMEGTA